MVAYVVSMVVANTVMNLIAANIPVGNSVTASTVENLNGVNIPGGSLVAANILAMSIAAASMVSVVATANIVTEAPNDSDVFCQTSGTHVPEDRLVTVLSRRE
jgi:hypothetical protein